MVTRSKPRSTTAKAAARKPAAKAALTKKPAPAKRANPTPSKAAPRKASRAVTATKVGTALKGGVALYAAETRGRTGAQAIAPDHSPRAKPTALRAGAALAGKVAGGDLKARVEQFLYAQSEMLDNKHWQDYIDQFAEDGVYWMPVMPEQTDWEGEPSIFAEDRRLMAVRMGRVTHPNAWSQAPMWATNHVIGNVVIESETAKEVVVRSRFHMMELRRDSVRHFGGTYRHTLVKKGDGFRIRLQRVDLFNGQAPFDYVLQVWV
jgi:3-phenylpropionate/cinnamic acid dioxygenase small subunit